MWRGIFGALNWLINGLTDIWFLLRDIGRVLEPCRFSVVAVLLGAVLLVFMPQGQEALMGLGDPTRDTTLGIAERIVFHIGVLAWAFSTWYWSRVMLDFRFPDTPAPSARTSWLNRHVPRIIGASAFIAVVAALIRATTGDGSVDQSALWRLAAWQSLFGLLFYIFVVSRRRLLHFTYRRASAIRPHQQQWATFWQGAVGQLRLDPQPTFMTLGALPHPTKVVLIIGLLIGGAAFVWGWRAPVTMGDWLGSSSIFLFAAATWVPVGSVLVYFGNRRQLPVLSAVLLLAALFSYFNNNHEVRTLPGELPERDTISMAFDDWYKRVGAPDQHRIRIGNDAKIPLILVATAGGASRAAFWTTTVLGTIDSDPERYPGFANHLFALSGVSGGSLGAALYAALVADQNERRVAAGKLRECAEIFMGHDFLAPTLSAMLFPDLAQRFLPGALFRDRAQAIEESWETAYRSSVGVSASPCLGDGDRFLHSVTSLRNGSKGWVPHLLLNGTWVELGNRLITSTITLKDGSFPDAVDVLARMGQDIRLSTAVNMSARFTYIMPAGRIPTAPSVGQSVIWASIVDGGYFENFGAATAEDLLVSLSSTSGGHWGEIYPIVIQISSDPDLAPTDFTKTSGESPPKPFAGGQEVVPPLAALMNTRTARGFLAATSLHSRVKAMEGAFFHFQMCKTAGRPPSLDWTMAEQTRRQIRGFLDQCNNKTELMRLAACLTNGGTACEDPKRIRDIGP